MGSLRGIVLAALLIAVAAPAQFAAAQITNNLPTAVDDTAPVAEDSSGNIIDALANDSTAPDTGETLTIVSVGATSAGGTATTDGSTISYSPAANFVGTETFSYTINDGTLGSDATATVTVTVGNVNDLPTAVDDTASVAEDSSGNIIDALANDSTAPDTGETLTIVSVGATSAGGTATTDGSTISYSPAANFVGTETFSYTINDGTLGSDATATVTVTVGNVNDLPTAVDDTASVAEDSSGNIIDALANDSTAPDTGETLTIVSVGATSAGGTATTDGSTISYSPAANFVGTETFSYTINDGTLGSDATATVTVTVGNVNDLPTAVDDTASVAEDSSGNIIDALANDSTAPDTGETLTIVSVGATSAGGTATTDGSTISYSPAANFVGTETFSYTINDGTLGSDATATVTVTVGNVNDLPTAVDDTASVAEDSSGNIIDALANDSTAPDTGETLTIVSVGATSAGGTATTDGSTISYSPAANFVGTETFSYTINDGTLGSDATATVTVTVGNVNDLPTAVDDTAPVAEDSSGNIIDALANDSTAPDTGETLTIVSVGATSAGGTATTDGSTISYSPAANFVGTETFSYTINDGTLGSDATATVTVTVGNVNDLPTAVDDTASVAEDSSGNIIDALANDSTAPDTGETLTIVSVGATSAGGTATTDGSTISYSPAANFVGTETFSYTINDGTLGSDATATVTVTVGNVNDLPTAVDDTAPVAEDSSGNIIDALANDSTAPDTGETLTIVSVGATSAGGTATTDGSTISYSPAANFVGTETFSYTINDGTLGSDATATVTVTVGNVNDLPTAVDDTAPVAEDSSGNIIDALANDSTAPDTGETLTIVSVGATSAGGTATTDGSTISYSPAANFVGTETFSYTINDGTLGSDATATVTVTVGNVNDLPTAVDDTASVAEDSSGNIIDALANDSTAPDTGETLTIVSVGATSAGGTATTDGSTISYSPAANFVGTETFSYTINDGTLGSDATATVTVTVGNVNDLPTAVDDTASVAEDSSGNIIDALANDSTAPDTGETLTIVSVGATSAGGTATTDGSTISYSPAANFVGTETFSYTINDGTLGSDATATVTVTVGNVNDLPTAVDDTASVAEDSSGNIIDALANDSTAPDTGETLTIVSVGATSAGGTATTDGSTISYSPAANFVGTETFSYTINDGTLGSDATATVTVTVGNVNDLPTAVDDTASVAEDSSGNIIDALANDSTAPDTGETLTIVSVGATSAGGTATTDGSTISYSPAANFVGTETFSYTINDGTLGSDATATVTVTVGNVNDLPTAVDDTASVAEDSSGNIIDALANDSTAPDTGETLTIVSVGATSAGGTATTDGSTISYSPAANFVGTETFSYTINDGTLGSDATATVTVTVGNVNDLPTAVDDTASVAEDSSGNIIDALANDSTAPDTGETLTIVSVGATSAGGTATTDGSTISYSPAANFVGTETFSYTINDGTLGSDATATVTVTVGNVNDLPTAVDDTASVAEDSSGNIIDALANDSTAPDTGETLTIVSVGATSAGGTATTDGSTISYSPAANFVGTETFSYTINDGTLGSDATATVTVTVGATDVVEELIAVIEDIINGVPGVEDPRHALKELEKALDHLSNSPTDPTRNREFNDHRNAIKAILRAIDKGEISDSSTIASLINVIDKVITADRQAAIGAINDAGLTPDANLKKIDKARSRLAEADKLFAEAQATSDLHDMKKLLNAADRLYRQAWKSATNAVGAGDEEHNDGEHNDGEHNDDEHNDDAVEILEERLDEFDDDSEISNLGSEVSQAAQLLQLLAGADKEEHDEAIELFQEYNAKLKEAIDVGQGNSEGTLEQKMMFGELDKLELKLRMQSLKVEDEDFKKEQIKEATELSKKQKELGEIRQQMTSVMVGKDWQERDKKLAELQEKETNMLRTVIMIEKAQNGEELTPEVLKNIDEEINEKVGKHQDVGNDENNNGPDDSGKDKGKNSDNDNSGSNGNGDDSGKDKGKNSDNDNSGSNGNGDDSGKDKGKNSDNDNSGSNGNGDDSGKDKGKNSDNDNSGSNGNGDDSGKDKGKNSDNDNNDNRGEN